MVLRDLALYQEHGAVQSKDTARRLNVSRRFANRTLSKLDFWEWVFRYGTRKCCFQKYRLNRAEEVPVRRILEHLCKLFRKYPERKYFNVLWNATVPCSVEQFSLPGRPGGMSVPFGARKAPIRADLNGERVFWVPWLDVAPELFSEVLEDIEREVFEREFGEPVEFELGDGYEEN